MSSRLGRAAGARAFTVSGRPPERDDVDDGGGDYRSTPENAACSVRHGRATTLSLGRCRLWPDLPRPRMAGFEVSTEADVFRCENLLIDGLLRLQDGRHVLLEAK